MTEKARRF